MSPFVLIGLLSFSFLLPIFTNSDDEDDIAEPTDPTPPETTVEGTAGDDTLAADSDETVNAGDGADVLGFAGDASDAQINGQAGNDTLTGGGTAPTLNGGDGDDVLSDAGSDAAVLNGDAGDDDITIGGSGGALVDGGLGNDEITALAETEGAVLNGGEGADTIDLRGTGNIANGGLGQDVLTLLGNNTLNGGEGDDTLTATDSATGTAATLLGGGGDDVLIHTQSGTANTLAVNADGGFGDDTLQAGLQLRESVSETLDTLTSGTGSDTFLLDLLTDVSADAFDDELIASVRITDFDPALDTLIIQTTNIDQGQASPPVRTVEGFTLFESDDGAFTDVEITFDEAGNDTVQTVRLFGVTGLQDSDLTLVS